MTTSGSADQVAIVADRTTRLSYFAKDNAGNVEIARIVTVSPSNSRDLSSMVPRTEPP